MKNRLIIAAIAATLSLSTQVRAEDMVFTSWGGTTQDVQKAAWADKFTETSGVAVLQDGPTDYGKIKAMVEAAGVTWDVVDVEGDYAVQAGKAGLLEKLDFSVIDKSKLDPRFVTDYSVGSFYYSFVIGCNKGRCLGLPEKLGRCVRHRKIPR
jgi:putative spermidine/putrescine transport system substrate-binding protein